MIEYVTVLIIVIGAFLVMRNYIQRGIFGMWRNAGQTFAFGRQYDSQKTVDCAFDAQSNVWYDRNCYNSYEKINQCNGGAVCDENIITGNLCSSSSCAKICKPTSCSNTCGPGTDNCGNPCTGTSTCTYAGTGCVDDPSSCSTAGQCGGAVGTDNCGKSCSSNVICTGQDKCRSNQCVDCTIEVFGVCDPFGIK